MKPHEFYKKYANVPLNLRDVPLSTINNSITLHQIYIDMHVTDEAIRTEQNKQIELMGYAEKIFTALDL